MGSGDETRIEAGSPYNKAFLFHKATILTNSLSSLKHWNVKYVIKVKILIALTVSVLLWTVLLQ